MPASAMAAPCRRTWSRSSFPPTYVGWSQALPPTWSGTAFRCIRTTFSAMRCHRIRLGNERIYHWDFERGEGSFALDMPGAITIDDTAFVLALTVAGAGLA